MNITETLKAKLDELEIEKHVTEAAAQAEKAVFAAMEKAGDYVHTHGEQIESFLDKATTSIHQRTDGKYADTVTKVRGFVESGVARIAEQRPSGDPATSTATDAATDPATDSAPDQDATS